MLMSSCQNKEVHVNYSTLPNKDPPEGKTTAVIAVIRGKTKDDYHHHCSNKNYKQKIVRVLCKLRVKLGVVSCITVLWVCVQ